MGLREAVVLSLRGAWLNMLRASLVFGAFMGLTATSAGDEKVENWPLSANAFFKEICDNKTVWTGSLAIGKERLAVNRLHVEVTKPCDNGCPVKALKLSFDFADKYQFPRNLRTSDGGFLTGVSPTTIAILSHRQCYGSDLPPKYRELRFLSCIKARKPDGVIEYVCRIYGPTRPEPVDQPPRPRGPKTTCVLTVSEGQIEGVILDREVRFTFSLLKGLEGEANQLNTADSQGR